MAVGRHRPAAGHRLHGGLPGLPDRTLITTGSLGAGFAPGLIAVVVFAAILVYLCMRTQKDLKSEYALSGAKS